MIWCWTQDLGSGAEACSDLGNQSTATAGILDSVTTLHAETVLTRNSVTTCRECDQAGSEDHANISSCFITEENPPTFKPTYIRAIANQSS